MCLPSHNKMEEFVSSSEWNSLMAQQKKHEGNNSKTNSGPARKR
jgi:hypothetical protein